MSEIIGFPHGFRGTDNGTTEPPCEVVPSSGNIMDDLNVPQHLRTSDPINPSHYKRNDVEAIDLIEHVVSGYSDPLQAGLVWQVLKYLVRAPYKGHLETDLHKAGWYMERLVGKVSK